MKIKYSIAAAVIAVPILFSHMALAGASGIPTWSGNNLDDGKREDTTTSALAATRQHSQAVQQASAGKGADAATDSSAPFWSGNTLAK